MFLNIRSTLANARSLKIRAMAPLIMHVMHREGVFAHGVDKTRELLHTIIEPIPEAIESMLDKIFCCTKIEPRIDYILSSAFVVYCELWFADLLLLRFRGSSKGTDIRG